MAEGKGLLDILSTPAGQGLLAAGFGALAGRGTRAQAIGQGGLAGLLAYGQATDGQRQAERQRMMDERQNEMFDWQRSAYQQQQEAARKAQEQQAAQQTYLGSLGKITSPRVDAQPNQADPRQMLGLGFSPEFISTYMNAGNLGKAKIKDYKEVRNADGSVTVTGFDEFGNVVNTKQMPFKAPDVRDFGGYVGGIDPITGKVTNYGQKTMSAAERDASARGWASHQLQKEQARRDAMAVTYQTDGSGNLVAVPTRINPGQNVRPIPVIGADGKPVTGKDGGLTEGQSKSYLFGSRASEANRILSDLQKQGVTNSGAVKRFAEGTGRVLGLGTESLGGTLANTLGTATNWTQSTEQQQVEQAKRDFVNAVLRKESGAVISPSEFDNADRQYFPQPGDDEATIKQKAANREIAIQGILAEVPAGRRPRPAQPAPSQDGWSIRPK